MCDCEEGGKSVCFLPSLMEKGGEKHPDIRPPSTAVPAFIQKLYPEDTNVEIVAAQRH